jgi:hypothetical protein
VDSGACIIRVPQALGQEPCLSPQAQLKVHHYLNAAQSLNNIAEMIESGEDFDGARKEAVGKELEMVIRFLQQQLIHFQ